jgi:predicted nucleic acid-binding protein
MPDEFLDRFVYLDTNLFIMAVEGTAETSAAPRKLLEALRARPGRGITSGLTLAETLAPPQRPDALPLHVKRRVYLDLLLWSGFIRLAPVTRDILVETADLRSVAKFRLPDAIHLVSAIRARCRYFVTGDRDFDRLPEGITRVDPDRQSIDDLVRVLA